MNIMWFFWWLNRSKRKEKIVNKIIRILWLGSNIFICLKVFFEIFCDNIGVIFLDIFDIFIVD